MDSVAPAQRHEILRQKIALAQQNLTQAASAAVLKNDPLADYLKAVAFSFETQADIYEAFETAHRDISHILKDASEIVQETVAAEALPQLHAACAASIDRLGPQLVGTVEKTLRQRQNTLKLRTLLGGAAALLAVMVVGGCLTYGTGYTAGQTQGEIIGKTTNTAMSFGPKAAAAWSLVMAYNDPVPALAACKKSMSADSYGRHYCPMPVWIDPPQPIDTSQ